MSHIKADKRSDFVAASQDQPQPKVLDESCAKSRIWAWADDEFVFLEDPAPARFYDVGPRKQHRKDFVAKSVELHGNLGVE